MKKHKITQSEREELVIKLTKLHEQALLFIAKMKDENTEKRISKDELEEFEKLTSQLYEYKEDIKYGYEPYTTYEEWCNLLGEVILDDDNFVIEEDGFSWH